MSNQWFLELFSFASLDLAIAQSLIAALPHIGRSMQVQNRQHVNVLCLCEEIHTIREVTDEGTVDVAVHTRELSMIVCDATKHYVEFIEKPQTQAGLLVSYHTAAAWISRSD